MILIFSSKSHVFKGQHDGGVYKVDLPHRFIADRHHEVVSFNPEQVPEVSESHGRTSSRKSIFLNLFLLKERKQTSYFNYSTFLKLQTL